MFNNSGNAPIKVACKRCKRQAVSTDFKLDPVYGMMVCPTCVKERLSPPKEKPKEEDKPKRPADWDAEDEFLEKSVPQRDKDVNFAKKIDDDHVQYKCKACGYAFRLNHKMMKPGVCPYCSAAIGKFKIA